jgi:hypothetical protein
MLRQYYDDINKRNYCDASDMWVGSSPNHSSCQEFSQGYQNTVHVDINFDSTQSTLSSDGRVYVILHVTNKLGNNAYEQIVYEGWYVVEQENGIWKINPHGSVIFKVNLPKERSAIAEIAVISSIRTALSPGFT